MKTKDIKLHMIERVLNYLDINGKLRIPANEIDSSPNLYLFDKPVMPFIVSKIYFIEDVLNIDIRSRSCVIGRLEEIRIKSDRKEFIFRSQASKEWQELKITHWLEIPELPY